MKTQRRRGFTVVELVVVIAIIAVLAAVLIPTFTSIIKKANDSAYLQERTNQKLEDLAEKVDKINYFTWEDFEKKLAEELAKVDTTDTAKIQEAVKAAMDQYQAAHGTDNTGLTEAQVQKIIDEAMKGQLTTVQVEAIVNQAISKVGGVNTSEVQAIVKSAIAGMSQTGLNSKQVRDEITKALAQAGYATDSSVSAAIAQALAKFDTLSAQDVAEIVLQTIENSKPTEGTIYIDGDKTLEAGKTYILRTQKSIETVTLTVPNDVVVERIIVDAPNVKTVNIVYADGATAKKAVNIIEVVSTAMTSTHINVDAKEVIVNKGRTVVGDNADTTVTTIKAAPSMYAEVVVEIATKATVENPVIAEYQDNGTGTNDTITIIDNTTSADGVEVELTASNELASSGTTTTNVQIQGTNISTDNVENNVATTTNNVEIVEVKINDTTYVKTDDPASEYSLFAGGTGTAEDPFLIFDYATMQNIQTMADLADSGEGDYGFNYYYKVKDGVTVIDCCEGNNIWKTVGLYGHFDGNGVTFNNLVKQSLFNFVEAWDKDGNLVVSEVKNFTVNANIVRTGTACAISYYTRDVVFSNITVHGYVEGGANSGLFVAYGPCYWDNSNKVWTETWNATFENCSTDATMVNTNGCASRLIGHPACAVSGSAIYVNNFSFTGKLYSNKADGGRLHSSVNTFNIFYVDGSETATASNTTAPCTQITVKNETMPAKYSVFTVNKLSGYDHSTASLIISPNGTSETGGFTGTYMVESSENGGLIISDTKISTTNIKNFDIQVNGSASVATMTHDNSGYSSDGKVYNIVNSGYGTTYANASVRIVQYNSQGVVIGISVFTLK